MGDFFKNFNEISCNSITLNFVIFVQKNDFMILKQLLKISQIDILLVKNLIYKLSHFFRFTQEHFLFKTLDKRIDVC